MKAKDAVLYFTDEETGKKYKVKIPEAMIGVEKEAAYPNNVVMAIHEPFVMNFDEYEISKVPEVKHVAHSNNVCTIIWSDGVKTQAVCHPEDTYNKDVGLLVAYLKRFMPTEDVINLVEKWSHQQKKQEAVQARKKSEKARKQFHEEMHKAKQEAVSAKEKNGVTWDDFIDEYKQIHMLVNGIPIKYRFL